MSRPRFFARLLCLAIVLGALSLSSGAPPAEPTPKLHARMGYTRALLRYANENDFRGAMRVYAKVVADNFRITTPAEPRIIESSHELESALRNGEIDVAAGLTSEILAVPPELLASPFFGSFEDAEAGVEYVLLVHEASRLRNLADLAQRTLIVLDNNDAALAAAWLENLCRTASLPPPSELLREITLARKPSQAALPVFFQKADACIITRASLSTLAELNPQLRNRLRVIAVSPRLVPVLTSLRADLPAELHERISTAITQVDSVPAGRQVLLLFQSERVRPLGESALTATRELLATQARPARPPVSDALSAHRSP